MKKFLTINATRDGKKVAKSLGFVNPDVANSIAGGFAQMVNALSNDTFVNAEVVKKMDTSEEEQQGGGSSTTKLEPTLTVTRNSYSADDRILFDVEYDGDGFICCRVHTTAEPISSDANNIAIAFGIEGEYQIIVFRRENGELTIPPTGEYELVVAVTETDDYAAKSVSVAYLVE